MLTENPSLKIPLTHGKFAIVDAEDYEFMNQWKWHCNIDGYASRTMSGSRSNEKRISKSIRMHRIIISAPLDKQVDHINGNRLDNRKSNLRICTKQENMRNQKSHKNSSSKFKGVTWNKQAKRWYAQITVNKITHYLGSFLSEEKAAEVYNKVASKHHGKFSNLNQL